MTTYQQRWYQENKERQAAYNEAWKKNNPEKIAAIRRRTQLKRNYGITPEYFDMLFDMQDGRCAICGTRRPGGKHDVFMVDHDHETDAVRGLLCHKCNAGLGLFNDNIGLLEEAIKYLEDGGSHGEN